MSIINEHIYLVRHGATFRTEQGLRIQGGGANEEDTWLSPKGFTEANILGNRLADQFCEDIKNNGIVIVSSPLKRCLQTADEINKIFMKKRLDLNLPPVQFLQKETYSDLEEVHHRKFEGLKAKLRDELCSAWYEQEEQNYQTRQEIPPQDWRWHINPLSIEGLIPIEEVPHPQRENPETINEVFTRGSRVVCQLTKNYPGKKIIAVTSGVVMWALATALEAKQTHSKDPFPMYYGGKAGPSYPKTCSVSLYTFGGTNQLIYCGTENLLDQTVKG